MRMLLFLLVIVAIVEGCDGGLAPLPPAKPGFSGTVYFESATWPPPDSVVNLWLFVSRIYPLDSAKVFNGLINGSISVFPAPDTSSITDPRTPVSSVSYEYPLSAGQYLYAGVIQRLRSDFNIRSFRVIGVYSEQGQPAQPATFEVPAQGIVSGIDIFVNFDQPPTQPF
jgi:hypothetical protein